MKLAQVIEGGLTGATTLALLQETLHGIDGKAPRPLQHRSDLLKQWSKQGKKKKNDRELYITLAGELLANAAFFGLAGLGQKKNALLRGGLLGAAAGLGMAFLQPQDSEDGTDVLPHEVRKSALPHQLLTVGLYTAGGLLAGAAVQKLGGKALKGKKGKNKKKK